MKNVTFASIFSAIFFSFSGVVTVLTKYFAFPNAWVPLIIAFVLLALNVVFAVLLKKNERLILYCCSFINSLALGFALRAWYLYCGYDNSILTMLGLALAAVLVLLFFYLISFIPVVDRNYSVFFWIFSVLFLALYIVSVCLLRTTYLSTFGYYLIVVWFLTICICNSEKPKDFYIGILIATFSVWLVAIIILIIMADGDGLDGDFIGFSADSPRNKRIIEEPKI